MWFILLIALTAIALMQRKALRAVTDRLARTETALANLEEQVFRLSTRPKSAGEGAAGATEGRPDARPQSPPGVVPPASPHTAEAARNRLAAAPTSRPQAPEPAKPIMLPPGSRLSGPARPAASVPPVAPPPAPSSAPTAAPMPQPPASWEERLGAHWAVYAGGLALALGGVYLVRYSIEAGLIGPSVRLALGTLLAAVLVGLGERFRRSELRIGLANLPDAHIPSVLTAAGTMVAFDTIYAAHALYGLIGPALTFVLLGAVGIATMMAAALHGPALAGLGLAGSYVTPLLISSDKPSPWPVVLYLAVVAGSAYLLARARRWLWLAWTAVAGATLWCFAYVGQIASLHLECLDTAQSCQAGQKLLASGWVEAAMVLVLVQTALAAFFVAIEPHLGTPDRDARPDKIAFGALSALAIAGLTVHAAAPFSHSLWLAFPALLMALLVITAWTSAPAAGVSLAAALVGLAAMLAWPHLNLPPDKSLVLPELPRVLWLPENVSQFLWFTGLFSVTIALAATVRLWRGPLLRPRVTALYAMAATLPPLLALVLAYLRVTRFDVSIPFAATGTFLGLGFVLAATRSLRTETHPQANRNSARLVTAAFAAAAIAALSFTLVAALSRGYLTVAFALAAFGTAYVATLKDVPLLRYAVTALGLVVLGRVAYDPRIMGAEVGHWPVLNWLLLGYGVPAAAFAGSARLLRSGGDDWASRLSDGLAVLFAGLFVFFELHHGLNGGDLTAPVRGHMEHGLLATTALLFTHVLTRLDLARANPAFYYGSLGFAAISLVFIAVGLGIDANPYLTDERVTGATVLSSLLPAYLLPGIVALYVARQARGTRPDWYVTAASALGLLLVFAYVSFEVRHGFHGGHIGYEHGVTGPETWAMTLAWLALGILALAYGLWRGSIEARIASAVLVVATVLKVVVVDLSGVSGLWRALSFICLGAVLIGIGMVYQRLVFANPSRRS